MSASLIDGKAIAAQIRLEIKAAVDFRTGRGDPPPGLAVVLVGENPASQSYVRAKTRACHEAGFHSLQIDKPDTISQAELLDVVAGLNANPAVHGILVQLPLPRHIDSDAIVDSIDPAKDVDGFHTFNAGRLATGRSSLVPCTPLGVRELLIRSSIETRGRHAVILGRSNIVGRPMAALLSAKGKGGDATVTVCHSATPDLSRHTREADILIAAIGRAEMVTPDMIKPGAAVIDVGINRVDDARVERGYRLVGDVKFDEVRVVAGAITPVPGGVGPMTIAMLLRNTLTACETADSPA